MPTDDDLKRLLADPSISYWLRDALNAALERDPVDAANDAGLLAIILDKRAVRLAEKMAALVRLAGEP